MPSQQRSPVPRQPPVPPSTIVPTPLAELPTQLAALPRRQRTTLADPLIETPLDRYAIESLVNEHQFNGSRPDQRLNTLFAPSQLRGESPYWDLDQEAIAAAGGALTVYGQAHVGPLRSGVGKTRIRLHYAERADKERMIDVFGLPHGHEPAFMRSSYRTLQIKADSGWHQFKFSMPEHPVIGSSASKKTLLAGDIQAAVCASQALGQYHAYAREPAGLALDLRDGGRPIAQLWRTLPVAERGFRPGDSAFVLHVMTDPKFAESARGRLLFSPYDGGRGEPVLAQQEYLRVQVAPRLADLAWLVLTQTHAHPTLHEQNIDVIVDRNGDVVDLIVKDLRDLALDRRGMEAAGHLDRWPALDETVAGSNRPLFERLCYGTGDEFSQVARHYQDYLGQVGSSFRPVPEREGNFLLDETSKRLVSKARRHIRPGWLESQQGSEAYDASFGTRRAGNIGPCVAGVRELLIRASEAGQFIRLPS